MLDLLPITLHHGLGPIIPREASLAILAMEPCGTRFRGVSLSLNRKANGVNPAKRRWCEATIDVLYQHHGTATGCSAW